MAPRNSSKPSHISDKNAKFRDNHPFTTGANLFQQARWFELTDQVRTDDPEHTRVVNRMYNQEGITMQDLQKYKLLSDGDFADPDSDWFEAPIIVSTNRERATLLHSSIQRYAACKQTLVFRWLANWSNWKQKPPEQYIGEALDDPCFYEYFVPGASGFFTDRVNKELGLVNARSMTYHSLSIDDQGDRENIEASLNSCKPGEIITLTRPPASVNVSLDPKDFTQDQLKTLQGLSIFEDSIVLPIIQGGTRPKENVIVRGGDNFRPSKVYIQPHFPLEPAFAITVHKAEGRTMEKVILALSYRSGDKCNMTYAAIYVALSRVCKRDDIRLLLSGKNNRDKWASVQYVSTMKPDPTVSAFLAGFKRRTKVDVNKNWSKREWDSKRALHFYERAKNGVSSYA